MIKQENKLNKRTQLSNDQVYSLQTVLKMSNISDFLFGQIFYQTNQLSAVDNTESDVTVSNEKKKSINWIQRVKLIKEGYVITEISLGMFVFDSLNVDIDVTIYSCENKHKIL